jgi:penicillin amidase
MLGALAPGPASAGDVEVLRDPWGVPHVFAASEDDGFFGVGYACAEDRVLQMDLLRRLASGRLAEAFGPSWVDSDRGARIAGHAEWAPRALASLPTEMQRRLRAYAAGVNAWMAANPDATARRFAPAGYLPEPWTPGDCLLAARGLLGLGAPFSDGPAAAYHRFRELLQQVGEEEAVRRSATPVDDSAAIVSEAEMAEDKEAYARLMARPKTSGLRGLGAAEGLKMSHAWAVGGSRSSTGAPILESDPQLPLSSPPFFHECHLSAGRISARGLGLPGCPGLFIGYNRRVAWGASALGTDSTTVFLDRLGRRPGTYLFQDAPAAFDRRLEVIHVKGGQDVVQEVLTNRHGTVFNSLVRESRAGEACMLYDAQTATGGTSAEALLAFMSAGTWAEFRAAMERYYDPGLHIVYADADGNVAYQTLVHRPLTAAPARLAQEGWTGAQEITGRVPLDEMPHKLNPRSGFISHANNMPVGSWYPHDLGIATGGTGHTGRSWRLEQLLAGDRRFSPGDFEAVIHRDDMNSVVAALLPAARKVVEEDGITEPAVLALVQAVAEWDMREGAVARFPAAAGLRNTLTPYRGAGLNARYGAGMGGVVNLARQVDGEFAATGEGPKDPAIRAYLLSWLRASADAAARGPEATITIPYQRCLPHNLPAVAPGLDIVSPPLSCLDTGTLWSQPGNFYTQVVNLADIDGSRAMLAPGNAEDPESPHRTSGLELWVRGEMRPAPLSRAAVEALGCTRATLTAQAYSGPDSAPPLSVAEADQAARLVPAIPAVEPPREAEQPRPIPGKKPDDPRLEAAFRVILRQGTAEAEVDAQLARCRELAAAEPALAGQLRAAAILGVYLIEESAAGRLVVKYGSAYVLGSLRELLAELGDGDATRGAGGAAEGQGGR